METSQPMDLECPVCHEDLKEPKILPCTHVACKGCLLTWLTKVGAQGGCPLCRAPIMTSTGDVTSQLDALPTNLVAVSLIDSRQILQSPNICSSCDDESASIYCMECNIKLCLNCLKYHKRFPATKNHVTKELSKLTTQQLAEKNRVACNLHPDRTAELFCSAHQQLICMLCGTTRHDGCGGKKMIDDVIQDKRLQLTERVSRLKEEEKRLEKQIKETKDLFTAMRQMADDMFDKLENLLDGRRRQVEQEVAKHEETIMMSVKELEQSRDTVSSNVAVIEGLKESASNAALLGMMSSLMARLDALDKQTDATKTFKTNLEMVNDPSSVERLHAELLTLGQVILKPKNESTCAKQETANLSLQDIPEKESVVAAADVKPVIAEQKRTPEVKLPKLAPLQPKSALNRKY